MSENVKQRANSFFIKLSRLRTDCAWILADESDGVFMPVFFVRMPDYVSCSVPLIFAITKRGLGRSAPVCCHPLRFAFRCGLQGVLKGFFTDQYINQIGSRVIEHMIIYDHAYMAWHSLKLKWYLVRVPKYGLIVSDLDYDKTAIFQHPDTKAMNRVEIINIGSVQAGGLHGHSLRT